MVRNVILVREKALSLVAVTWHFLLCGGFSSSLLVQFQLTWFTSVN